jgi:hypothetical protein
LEFDFLVNPGATIQDVVLKFSGTGRLHIDDSGALVVGSSGDDLRINKPVAYQEIAGVRRFLTLPASFLTGMTRLALPLVITTTNGSS